MTLLTIFGNNSVKPNENLMPLTAKEMIKLLLKHGYEEIKGQGKGSHRKLKKGNKMVIVPYHGELKKGMEYKLLKLIKEDR